MIIAIDGFSSCGKSTIAKELATKLNLIYVDTGAMYRAVTLYFMKNKVDFYNLAAVSKELDNIQISFERLSGVNTTFLNGENVEQAIRSMEVSNLVSDISTIGVVRDKLVAMQREMNSKGLVMDGRDIGTVVFPKADFKFFLVADSKVRAERRYNELKEKGMEATIEEIINNIEHRDHIDSTRIHSPLRKADDAIEIDNSYLTKEAQMNLILDIIEKKNA